MMYAKNDSVLICAATKSTYTSLLNVGDFLKNRKRIKDDQYPRKTTVELLTTLK